jgi:biopolymer transport protein ExbD
MVSLADIAFLIIFFFMLSSTFMNDKSAIALPVLPKAGETTSAFAVTLVADGSLSLDGARMATPADLESALRAKLAGRTNPKDCEVRFRCDKAQTYKVYHPIYEAIADAGGVIAIMHEVK